MCYNHQNSPLIKIAAAHNFAQFASLRKMRADVFFAAELSDVGDCEFFLSKNYWRKEI